MPIVKLNSDQVKMINGVVEFVYRFHFGLLRAGKNKTSLCMRRLCLLWDDDTIKSLPCGVHQLNHTTLVNEPKFRIWELSRRQAALLVFMVEQCNSDHTCWFYAGNGVVARYDPNSCVDLQTYVNHRLSSVLSCISTKFKK